MELLLNKIINECSENDIKFEVIGEKNGHMSYALKGVSKSKKADLYIEDGAIVFETNGKKEHVLSFRDLVNVAHNWLLIYKDKAPFQMDEPGWGLMFKKYINISKYINSYDNEDLPF